MTGPDAVVIAENVNVATAALTLLTAGHADAAADLIVAASRMTDAAADLAVVGGKSLRVRLRDVTA